MASFSRLPDELLLLVAQQLTTQPDIYHLTQVDARCYRALHSHLCVHNVQHHGSTALLWAAQKGKLPLIAKLLAAGANIVTWSRQEETREDSVGEKWIFFPPENPLLEAAQGGHTAALQLMLAENRPNQAASPDQLRTLLHWALRAHDGPLVDLLLGQRRAPFDSRTYRDWPSPTPPDTWPSALNVALEAEYYTIVPRLVEQGATPGPYRRRPCPIEQAICGDQLHLVKLFLQQGWMPHRDHGICYIADTNNIAMLQVLLDHGLDLRLYGTGALCVAIWAGHYDIVKMLLDHGASTRLGCIWESTDRSPQMDGYTPVGFAVKWRRLEILRLLLDSGAHADWAEFDMAREQGFEEAADLLLEFEKSDPEPLITAGAFEEAGDLLFETPIELLDPDLVVPDRVELLVLDVPGGVTDASQIWEGMSRINHFI
ncbi:ankyrin repeat domain-containing protein [Aspergillus aculeatinus CBS 121060]|uniref:Ankyrin n=1 Tax=Aspergillus aculeatinus CBS 121060 TaxID=1448322 RepID=A0ACD1HMM2_9EURO|nr:ankyrin [Aspergillus aculeatinus CBS 121060]RAH74820.1 ankyrin [Aspergillus aculeatinus CBS 121060]